MSNDSEQHRRVLVVDDDADIRKLLVTALRLKSLPVDAAHDGTEAINLLHKSSYGVVLLDLFMPHIDGFAVLDEIERSPNPPVVLVVTGADRGTVGKLDTRRIHGVVRKPFDVDELTNLVTSMATS